MTSRLLDRRGFLATLAAGPATEPLRRFPSTVKGDKLIVKLPEEPVLPAERGE